MTGLREAQLRRRLQDFIDSPLAERCIACGHAGRSHNDLGYCQIGGSNGCSCRSGVTIGGTAMVILRDLPKVSAELLAAHPDESETVTEWAAMSPGGTPWTLSEIRARQECAAPSSWTLVSRQRTRTPDRVGPWLPVETEGDDA